MKNTYVNLSKNLKSLFDKLNVIIEAISLKCLNLVFSIC